VIVNDSVAEFDKLIVTEEVRDLELDLVCDFDFDLERERDLLRDLVGLGPSEPSLVSVLDWVFGDGGGAPKERLGVRVFERD